VEKEWTMVRIPRDVHQRLLAFAERFAPKSKGKRRASVRRLHGEVLVTFQEWCPLHEAIAELLRRDDAHRNRGKRRKGT